MKRHPALQYLSHEHHATLSLAQRILRAAQRDDESALAELTAKVRDFHPDLEMHFQKEESGVFHPLCKLYPEHIPLAQTYLDEHKLLLAYSHQATESPSLAHLAQFALLLKEHTRREERDLFPLIEACFSEAELTSIGSSNN